MGRINKILSFVRSAVGAAKVSNVKVDPGGGANRTAQHFAPAGDDSHPLPDDYAATIPVQRTGSEVAVGYVDPKNEQKAQPGEKRIYARDPSDGSVVVEVWLKNTGEAATANENGSATLRPDGGSVITTPKSTLDAKADGSIKGVNSNGSFELQAGGNFVVNGVTIDISGNITSPATITAPTVAGSSSLTVAGKEMGGHAHAGSPTAPTGPVSPTGANI